MRIALASGAIFVTMLNVGCSGNADAAGEYSLSLTNRDNQCMFENWTEGQTTVGVQLSVVQNDDAVTATVGGLAGPTLDIFLGSHVFTGTIDGEHLDLHIQGERAGSMGGCAYTINADVSADLNGDTLTGAITYVPLHNNSPDCGYLLTCTNRQDFNGTRPPR